MSAKNVENPEHDFAARTPGAAARAGCWAGCWGEACWAGCWPGLEAATISIDPQFRAGLAKGINEHLLKPGATKEQQELGRAAERLLGMSK